MCKKNNRTDGCHQWSKHGFPSGEPEFDHGFLWWSRCYKPLHRQCRQWATNHYTDSTDNELQTTTHTTETMSYKPLHRQYRQWATNHYTHTTDNELQTTTQTIQTMSYKPLHRQYRQWATNLVCSSLSVLSV
jgi:hypothetical protein